MRSFDLRKAITSGAVEIDVRMLGHPIAGDGVIRWPEGRYRVILWVEKWSSEGWNQGHPRDGNGHCTGEEGSLSRMVFVES